MTLTLMLMTYGGHPERREYARRTLSAALERIKYSGRLLVHIADDGSPPEHRAALCELAGGFPQVEAVTFSNSERGGYGASYNAGTQVVHGLSDFVLPLEDDWVLSVDLDVDPMIWALQNDPRIGCIRLGYLGTTQPLYGEVIRSGPLGYEYYVLFDPASPEFHVFAGGPRIESVEWERSVGPWPDTHYSGSDGASFRQMTPGDVEFTVAKRPESRQRVCWPMEYPNHRIFSHIGTVQSVIKDGAGLYHFAEEVDA